MESRRRRKIFGLRADLLWCLAVFVLAQIVLDVSVDRSHPELFDLEYGIRLRLLQTRLAENPGWPLLLAVGSSHVGQGIEPEVLEALPAPDGRRALPFNFSHLAAGPIMNLLNVQRLLGNGIHPRWLVLEIAPTCLCHEPGSMPLPSATANDLKTLKNYFDPWEVWTVYLRGRLDPWFKHRLSLLQRYSPGLVTIADATDIVRLEPLGGDRVWLSAPSITPEERQRRIDVVREVYFDGLQHYRIQESCARATRDLLRLCAREKISVVLLLTPEAPEFRSWYSAEALQTIDEYLEGLTREFNVPIVDSRGWAGNEDFRDAHHLLTPAAIAYTQRLGHEVFQPLVRGRISAVAHFVRGQPPSFGLNHP